MAQDKELVWKKLSALWGDTGVKTLPTAGKRYAIISDTHFGNGSKADDFYPNRTALLNALEFYKKHKFDLILLGDIEEFWQFDLAEIVKVYEQVPSPGIYPRIRNFGDPHILRIFGNHDLEWGGLVDPTRNEHDISSFADEALRLETIDGEAHLLLVHGHQGSLESDKFAWLSRFFVRLYRGVEPWLDLTGLFVTGSSTKSQVPKDFERTLYGWAKENKVLLICGHSHRAIFASKSHAERLQEQISALQAENMMRGVHKKTRQDNLQQIDNLQREYENEKEKGRVIEPVEVGIKDPLPCYFNSGCGLYTDGLTCIEIEDDLIRLVKWSKYSVSHQPREVYNEGKISEFVSEIIREQDGDN